MIIMIEMVVMVEMVIMFIMVIRTDRTTRTHSTDTTDKSEKKQTGQTDLTFLLDFPGNYCRAAFAILVLFHSLFYKHIIFKSKGDWLSAHFEHLQFRDLCASV